jgi:hypothetical protein
MIITIKLSEILDGFRESGENFICFAIWGVFSYKYDVDIDVGESFRKQWYSKVLKRPDFFSFYMDDWNRYSQYSVEVFVAETGIEYGRHRMSIAGYSEYRIWVMERVIATIGDIEFVFSDD